MHTINEDEPTHLDFILVTDTSTYMCIYSREQKLLPQTKLLLLRTAPRRALDNPPLSLKTAAIDLAGPKNPI